MTGRQAFQGWCYMCSDAMRLARAALDNGSTADELIPIFTKHTQLESLRKALPMALQYMVDNPTAGVVKWINGNQWDWADKNWNRDEVTTA